MKKIVTILAVWCAACSAATVATTPTLGDPVNGLGVHSTMTRSVDPAKPDENVCKVVARNPNFKGSYMATAFFISPTRLLTAAHTFKKTNDQWVVREGREIHCKMIKIDFKKDCALLEIEEGSCSSFFRLVSTVKLIGFPYGKEMETSTGSIDKEIRAHAYFVEGMSGCPLVNDFGDVEGMGLQDDWGNGHETCHAIQASALAEFVKNAP